MESVIKRKYHLMVFIVGVAAAFFLWQAYVPYSFVKKPAVFYTVKKGMGARDIAKDLEQQKLIKSSWFFNMYAFVSGGYGNLQAGDYQLSSSMSLARIVWAMTTGDVVKNNLTLIEGWDLQDIGAYLESKNLGSKTE